MNNDDFKWLQSWYKSKCNGDWEHSNRIRIETIDNPGWSISLNLYDTALQNKPFEIVDIKRDSENWIYCFVDKNRFEGRCGALNLSEVLKIFREWTEKNEKTLKLGSK